MNRLIKHALKATLVAALVTGMAAGCANPRREGTGTNDTVRTRALTNNYKPFNFGTGNNRDMRLGLDRYRGTDPDLIRDSDNLRLGLNRDNGITGYDRDGVNRWSDYHANTRMEASQQIADQVAAIDPVQSANVLLTDNNAYVAVKTKNGADLDAASNVKAQIAEKVRSIRPDIRNVYVSSNPDFVNRVNEYAQHLREGRPVTGFINEFNEMVQRIFPANVTNPAAPGQPAR